MLEIINTTETLVTHKSSKNVKFLLEKTLQKLDNYYFYNKKQLSGPFVYRLGHGFHPRKGFDPLGTARFICRFMFIY